MSKYQVECGAFVEYFRGRVLIVNAKSPEEAEQKAEQQFRKLFKAATDIGTVTIDACEQID